MIPIEVKLSLNQTLLIKIVKVLFLFIFNI